MTERVTVELTEDGPSRIRGNGEAYEPGDQREVSREHADALPSYWRVVDTHTADAVGEDDETCVGLGGECGNPAGDDGYCWQHAPTDGVE